MTKRKAPTSMQDLRQNNYNIILLAIEEAAYGISRTQISQETKLSTASVTLICDDLLKRGIITEVESAFSLKGRKPILLKISPAFGIVGALIIDATHKASLAFATMDYRILSRQQISFVSMEHLIEQTNSILARQGGPILGLGIAISQEYSVEENWSYPVHGIQPEQLMDAIRGDSPIAIQWMEHDRMCLESYLRFFQKAPCVNPLYLHFDDSISATAYNGSGGDLGHITFQYHDGKDCYCGKQGCARRYCAPSILVDFLRQADSDPYLDEKISSYADAILALCDSAARIYGADQLILGGEIAYFNELLNPLFAKKMTESDNILLHNLKLKITDHQDILELKGTFRLAGRAVLDQFHWYSPRSGSCGKKEEK